MVVIFNFSTDDPKSYDEDAEGYASSFESKLYKHRNQAENGGKIPQNSKNKTLNNKSPTEHQVTNSRYIIDMTSNYFSTRLFYNVSSRATLLNLMNLSIEDILQTFSDHEDQLSRVYSEHIKELVKRSFRFNIHRSHKLKEIHFQKRNYVSKDLTALIALDIVSENQLQAMANFVELKFVKDLADEHNVSLNRFNFETFLSFFDFHSQQM